MAKNSTTYLKTIVTCQQIASKKILTTSMGQYPSLRYGQVILVNGYPVLTAFNLSQHGCAISGCTWAPKLATKCEMDGRAVGVWSGDYQIFSDG